MSKKDSQKSLKYGLKTLTKIAYHKVLKPDTASFEGLKDYLITWFMFKYKTTSNDDRLLNMTLEELALLYQMHMVRENPQKYEEEFNPDIKSYEEWLKEEMGEEYVTADEMEDLEKKQNTKDDKKQDYPDKINIDYTKILGEKK